MQGPARAIAPTSAKSAIVSDLQTLNKDVSQGTIPAIFADAGKVTDSTK